MKTFRELMGFGFMPQIVFDTGGDSGGGGSDSGSSSSSSSSSSSTTTTEIPEYDNYYDAIDAEGVGATVNIGGNIVSAETADGYTGSSNTPTSFADDFTAASDAGDISSFMPPTSTNTYSPPAGSDNDNDSSYDDFAATYDAQLAAADSDPYGMTTADGYITSGGLGVDVIEGNDGPMYVGYDPSGDNTENLTVTGLSPEQLAESTAGVTSSEFADATIGPSMMDDAVSDFYDSQLDPFGGAGPDVGASTELDTTTSGYEDEAYGGPIEDFYNDGGFNPPSNDDSFPDTPPPSVAPPEPPTFYDAVGNEYGSQEEASAADAAAEQAAAQAAANMAAAFDEPTPAEIAAANAAAQREAYDEDEFTVMSQPVAPAAANVPSSSDISYADILSSSGVSDEEIDSMRENILTGDTDFEPEPLDFSFLDETNELLSELGVAPIDVDALTKVGDSGINLEVANAPAAITEMAIGIESESDTPSAAELAADLAAQGLTNITPGSLSVEDQVDQYPYGLTADGLGDTGYAGAPDIIDATGQIEADLTAMDALESGLYDDVILDTGEGGLTGKPVDVGATDDDLATDFSTVSTDTGKDLAFQDYLDGLVDRDFTDPDQTGLEAFETAQYDAGDFTDNNTVDDFMTGKTTSEIQAIEDAADIFQNEGAEALGDFRMDLGMSPVDPSVASDEALARAEEDMSGLDTLAEAALSGGTDDDTDVVVAKTREQKIDDLVAAGVDRTLAEASIDSLEGGVNVDDGTSAAELRDTLVEQVMSTQPTASELYLSAMGKVGSGVSDFSPEEQRALYGARGQVPNAAETAYLQSLLRDVKHTSDGPIDEREYITEPTTYASTYDTEKDKFEGSNQVTGGGGVIANPNFGKPMYEAGDSVTEQTLGETVEDFFVKAFDIFVNPLTIFGDDYTLEGANARNVQAQLDAYKNGGTFVYGEDGATVVGVAQPNFDASGDGNKDTVVLINDDGEITVSSGAVAKVDIENSNKNSGLDSDVDDIDLIDSGTTFTNTEDGVVQESAFDDIVVGGDDSGADPCPEGFYLDPVTGICMPMDDIGEGGDASGGGISIGGINRGGSGFDYITGGVPSDAKGLKIKTPKQFNRGGMVSPNIDRFIQSLAS